MKQTADRRVYEVEVRAVTDGEQGPRIEGLAVPYGVWTDLGPFRERVAAGAFREYLGNPENDVVYNYGHDRNAIMGRRSSGTLQVRDDDEGVHVSLELPDTTMGRDLAVMVRRGDIRGHSIEFTTTQDEWRNEDGKDSRTVVRGGLPGVALVGNPAYSTTTAAMRSLEDWHRGRVVRSVEQARLMRAQAMMGGARVSG